MERDGGRCRVPSCLVPRKLWVVKLELAHCWHWKRSKTRGRPPEERHPTCGAMMLCLEHHRLEETNQLVLLPLSVDFADGPVRFLLDWEELGTS